VQENEPSDYVLATGSTHSVREFLDAAFNAIGIEDWSKYVVINPKFFRPAEVDYLLGKPDKAKDVLSWTRDICFDELARKMVQSDIEKLSSE